MIWAEGEKSKELSSLREDLEEALTEKIRFVPENRTFAPHITLARISSWGWKQIEPEERPEVNGTVDLPFTVESIEVMESELKRGGPVYTILESHNLKE
jgi:2'-5' RNA ligase